MSDKEVIEQVARLWLALGGDAEGLEWTWRQLRDKIKELENEK